MADYFSQYSRLFRSTILLAGIAGVPLAGQTPCVEEIQIPGAPPPGVTVRRDLAVDGQGRVWFTQLELNQIGKYDPDTDQFDIFDIPTPNTGPHSIDVDSQGVVWFTETSGEAIGSFDPQSEIFTEQPTPTPGSRPYGINIDLADNVWFTDMNGVKIIVRLAATGQMIEFPLNPLTDNVENLEVDSVRALVWVTDLPNGKLILLHPATGTVFRYPLGLPGSSPHSVSVAPNGFVWFSDIGLNQIGRLNPATGVVRRFNIPTPDARPHGIIVDSRGLVWFAELGGNKVGLLVPQFFNLIFELAMPSTNSSPYFVAEAPNGEIWASQARTPTAARLPCTAAP